MVELLGSDLRNPGQRLVLLTIPPRPGAVQCFYMIDGCIFPQSCLPNRCGGSIHQRLRAREIVLIRYSDSRSEYDLI